VYTDSSSSGLQVKLGDSRFPSRYIVACQRSPVPLADADTAGTVVVECVTRPWQPAPPQLALQSVLLGPDAALTFDIFDTMVGKAALVVASTMCSPAVAATILSVNGTRPSARLARFESSRPHTPGAGSQCLKRHIRSFPYAHLRRKLGILTCCKFQLVAEESGRPTILSGYVLASASDELLRGDGT